MCIDMRIDMRIDMFADVCTGMWMNTCTGQTLFESRHAHTRATDTPSAMPRQSRYRDSLHSAVVDALIAARADVDLVDVDGFSPMALAAAKVLASASPTAMPSAMNVDAPLLVLTATMRAFRRCRGTWPANPYTSFFLVLSNFYTHVYAHVFAYVCTPVCSHVSVHVSLHVSILE